MLSPGPWSTVLATSKSLSLTAPSPSASVSPPSKSVSASVLAPQGPRDFAFLFAWRMGSVPDLMLALLFARDGTRLLALSFLDRLASRVLRMAALRSASA